MHRAQVLKEIKYLIYNFNIFNLKKKIFLGISLQARESFLGSRNSLHFGENKY